MNEEQITAVQDFAKAIQAKAKKDKDFAKALSWLAAHWMAHYRLVGHRNLGRALWDAVLKPQDGK